MKIQLKWAGILLLVTVMAGCSGLNGGTKRQKDFAFPDMEAEWIRNGEPLEFEGELWYPQDIVDVLLDTEVFLVGEYKKVNLFVQRLDVRPYSRIYTKFGERQFRIFRRSKQSREE